MKSGAGVHRTAFVSVVGGALVAALALAGCEGSVEVGSGPPSISEPQVEKEVKQKLTQKIGVEPDDIDCPGALKGVEGTTMTCELTEAGDHLDVALEVTSVKGTTVNFSIEVGQVKDPS